MKNLFRTNKPLLGFVAGLVTFALVSTSLAAVGDVIPNFTALEIGNPSGTASDGEIQVENNLVVEGVTTAGAVRTNTILSTSGSAGDVSVIGDLEATEDLDVDGDADISGSLEADEIGSFYEVNENCTLNNCDAYNTFYTLTASCAEGDYAINCNGIYDWDATWAVYNTDELQSCTLLAEKNGPLYITAVCFNPDNSDPDAPQMQIFGF